MSDIKKIMYPLELSHVSPHVAPWVVTMAQKWDAELHVVHVVPGMEFWGVAYASEALIAKDMPLLMAKVTPLVDEFCLNHFKAHPPVAQEVLSGEPAKEIVTYAESKGIDMIVMGTHSHAGLDRVLFGSVADMVVRTSPVPVLVVPPVKS